MGQTTRTQSARRPQKRSAAATSSRRKPAARKHKPSASRRKPATRKHRPAASGTTAAVRRTPVRSKQSTRRPSWLHPLGLLMVVVVIGAMAVTPWASLTAATERVEALEGEQASLGEAVDELQAEADRLQDPLELEGPAREDLGLSRPGEVPYIVVNPPTEAPAPVNAPPVSADDSASESVWQRVGDWFADLLP